MEDKFQTLIHSNDSENRNKWALEWKEKGNKVIGLMNIYVPEEIISAAGLLPSRRSIAPTSPGAVQFSAS